MSDRGAPEPGDGGWLLSAIPLQLNDGPTAACPPGGKTLLREEGSPRALPSLKLVADNRSNLVSSSVKCSPPSPHALTHPRVQPPAPVQSAPGSQGQDSNDQLSCSGFILLMFFPACHWSFFHFFNVRRKLVSSCPSRELCLHFNTLESNRRPITHICRDILFFRPLLMEDLVYFIVWNLSNCFLSCGWRWLNHVFPGDD